jgi:hypothetical protein
MERSKVNTVPPPSTVEHRTIQVQGILPCPVCSRPRWFDGNSERYTHCELGIVEHRKPVQTIFTAVTRARLMMAEIHPGIFCPRCPGTVSWLGGNRWVCRVCGETCLDSGLRKWGVNAV